MKISIIGAGNVGGLTAMRLAEGGFGDIVLMDTAKGLAEGKALDLDDSGSILKNNYNIQGTDDIKKTEGSDIIVITAGLARKPQMTREDLATKNAQILKDICINIKNLSPYAMVIVVTNPLDLMAYLVLKITGFRPQRVFGMGISLDTARFANIISRELDIANTNIDATVIGVHGEGMLPLPRLTNIKGVKLDEIIDDTKIEALVKKTVERGQEIVALLDSGSAYFAPSQAIATIIKTIVKDEKRTIGASVYLNGEYDVKDVCIGVPCRIGREGIERIFELDLNEEERRSFLKSAECNRKNLELIKPFWHGL